MNNAHLPWLDTPAWLVSKDDCGVILSSKPGVLFPDASTALILKQCKGELKDHVLTCIVHGPVS